MIVVSACLVGEKCRYDGNSNRCEAVVQLVQKGEALPVCPEELGGLSTPRDPAEIVDGRVITRTGNDVTKQFEEGARLAVEKALTAGCTEAIVKQRSPSCGCGRIYDGSFTGRLIEGDGFFTRLLKEHNIEVLTEEDI